MGPPLQRGLPTGRPRERRPRGRRRSGTAPRQLPRPVASSLRDGAARPVLRHNWPQQRTTRGPRSARREGVRTRRALLLPVPFNGTRARPPSPVGRAPSCARCSDGGGGRRCCAPPARRWSGASEPSAGRWCRTRRERSRRASAAPRSSSPTLPTTTAGTPSSPSSATPCARSALRFRRKGRGRGALVPTTGRSALRAPAERGRCCGAERGRCGRLTAGRSRWREPWGPAHCAPGPTASPQAHRPEFFTDWLSCPPCMSTTRQTILRSLRRQESLLGMIHRASKELST